MTRVSARPIRAAISPQPLPPIDRRIFFNKVRKSVFHGRLNQGQVDGLTAILDYRDSHWPKMIDEELACVLGQCYHESAHTMQPIKERGSFAYLSSKPYYPYYGRGLIQLTWRYNYAKFGITNPDDLLKMDVSLRVMFEGMIKGMFTEKKLADYIHPGSPDFVNARRVVNGTDKAEMIAEYCHAFLDALHCARAPHEFNPSEMISKEEHPVKEAVVTNWKTTLSGVAPAIPYVLQLLGFWPKAIPLPPFETVWPAIASSISIGAFSKDWNVTGGTKQQ